MYFGDLGPNMETLIKYFEDKGSLKCPRNANPAEWMLEVIGAAPGSHADRDWAEQWTNSAERAEVHRELAEMKKELSKQPVPLRIAGYGEFAMPLWYQFLICTQRMFQQYWRSPSYLYAKALTCTVPVSYTPPFYLIGLTGIATVPWIHLLAHAYQPTRAAESDVCTLYASRHLPGSGPADDAVLCHAAFFV